MDRTSSDACLCVSCWRGGATCSVARLRLKQSIDHHLNIAKKTANLLSACCLLPGDRQCGPGCCADKKPLHQPAGVLASPMKDLLRQKMQAGCIGGWAAPGCSPGHRNPAKLQIREICTDPPYLTSRSLADLARPVLLLLINYSRSNSWGQSATCGSGD